MNKLEKLNEECLSCSKCEIGCQSVEDNGEIFHSNVMSNMANNPKVVVVGQNPGMNEIKQKTPFVGASGKFFDKALNDVLGIDRSQLYICNVVSCFTPKNRSPKKYEIQNCRYFLDKQIEIIKPNLIVTLGNYSLKEITCMSGIMKHHGKIITSSVYSCKVLPMLHPSPLNMNKQEKREMFYEDLKALMEYL